MAPYEAKTLEMFWFLGQLTFRQEGLQKSPVHPVKKCDFFSEKLSGQRSSDRDRKVGSRNECRRWKTTFIETNSNPVEALFSRSEHQAATTTTTTTATTTTTTTTITTSIRASDRSEATTTTSREKKEMMTEYRCPCQNSL